MLFRRKIEAMAGRLEVRESVFKLLIAVVTTSSRFDISVRRWHEFRMLTNKMFQDDRLVTLPSFGCFPHLHSLTHLPVSIAQ